MRSKNCSSISLSNSPYFQILTSPDHSTMLQPPGMEQEEDLIEETLNLRDTEQVRLVIEDESERLWARLVDRDYSLSREDRGEESSAGVMGTYTEDFKWV